jgi:uncharacterized protein (TIGR00369 family)
LIKEIIMANLLQYLDDWVQERIDPPPVVGFLGIKLLACADGTARVEMETSAQHHNPMGIVHGGILCDLADVAMGVAVATKLQDGQTFSTTDLHIHYFKSVQKGLLTAVAEVVHRGRSTVFVECKISDEKSIMIAKASSTCLIR